MRRRLRRLLPLLLLLPGGNAWSANAALKSARDTFDYGNYSEAAQIAKQLLDSHQLGEEHDLIDAYRIVGLSSFYLGRLEASKGAFVGLLSVDPDYSMDPFLVPPAAVAYFDGVKRDSESLLAPIRAQRKAMAEQERLAEEARRKLFEDQMRRQIEPDRPVLVQRIEKRTFALNFFPFGAGEFQEDRPWMGGGAAALQVGGLATFFTSFAYIASLEDQHGEYAPGNIGTAQSFTYVKWAGLAGFGAVYAASVIDSLLHYEGSPSRIEALPQPPQHNAPGPPAPPGPQPGRVVPPTGPSASPKTTSFLLLPWASPTASGLSLQLTF